MNRPVSTTVKPALVPALRKLFSARGHTLASNPKNRYIAFEVRTDGKSIFTLYTSHKLVMTVREGDAEGLILDDELRRLIGLPAAGSAAAAASASASSSGSRRSGVAAGTRPDLRWLCGMDETGTGELLGTAVVGAALIPKDSADEVAAVTGRVDTKASRTATGWETLGVKLAGLSGRHLHAAAVPIPNHLFDGWGKHALLDLAYVRVLGDVFLDAGLDGSLDGVEIVIDDYGIRELLTRAVEGWRGRGAHVIVQTKADDEHLAARTAAVLARSQRAREMSGAAATVDDGPIGTGNAGHRETLNWLRRRHASGRPWPRFVKQSFKTVTRLYGRDPAPKRPVPALQQLVDEATAADLLAGRLDATTARLALGDGRFARTLVSDPDGRLVDTDAGAPPEDVPAWELLPLLCGGLVLADGLASSLDALDALLAPEQGALCGWRVLMDSKPDPEDAATVLLARAHAEGRVTLVPTRHDNSRTRARAHGAFLLSGAPGDQVRWTWGG